MINLEEYKHNASLNFCILIGIRDLGILINFP